jgi:hypothetical protein
MVETNKMGKHPGVIYNIDKNDSSNIGLIMQSSNKFYDVRSTSGILKKEESIISIDKGLFNKPGVFNYPPVTVDLESERIKLSSVYGLYNINKISEQKRYFLKAFLLGLYEPDKIFFKSVITESTNYNRYIDRIVNLYNSNSLPDDLKYSADYILEFNKINNLENDFIKMKLWDYIVTKAIVINNGDIIFPDDDLFVLNDIKNAIDVLKQ